MTRAAHQLLPVRTVSFLWAFYLFSALIYQARGDSARLLANLLIGDVRDAEFLKNGDRILTAGSGGAFLWDWKAGQIIARYSVPYLPLNRIFLSKDEQRLVGGSRGIAAWQIANPNKPLDIPGPTPERSGIDGLFAVPDDFAYAVASIENKPKAISLIDGSVLHEPGVLGQAVGFGSFGQIFQPNTHNLYFLYRTGNASDIAGVLLNVDSGELAWTTTEHDLGNRASLGFSPDGLVIAEGTSDGSGIILRYSSGVTFDSLLGFSGSIESLAFSKDGSRFAAISRGVVSVYDTQTWTRLAKFDTRNSEPTLIKLDASGNRLLAVQTPNRVQIWETSTGNLISMISAHNGRISTFKGNPANQAIFTAQMSAASLHQESTGAMLRSLDLRSASSRIEDTNPSATTVAVISENGGSLNMLGWDGKPLKAPQSPSSFQLFMSAAFAPDDRAIAISVGSQFEGSSLLVQDFISQTALANLVPASTTRAVFSPNGPTLGVLQGNPPQLLIGSITDSDWRHTYSTPAQSTALALDGNGEHACYAVGNNIRMIDVQDGSLAGAFTGHTETVTSCAFSPDSSLLLTTSLDGSARVWDVANFNEVLRLPLVPDSGLYQPQLHLEDSPSQPSGVFGSRSSLVAILSTLGTAWIWDISEVLQESAPTILKQPNGVSLNPSQNWTLVVEAGAGRKSYRWFEGLPGDTTRPVGRNSGSFVVPPSGASTAYWVRITNSSGFADSAACRIVRMTADSVSQPRLQLAATASSLSPNCVTILSQNPSSTALELRGLRSGIVHATLPSGNWDTAVARFSHDSRHIVSPGLNSSELFYVAATNAGTVAKWDLANHFGRRQLGFSPDDKMVYVYPVDAGFEPAIAAIDLSTGSTFTISSTPNAGRFAQFADSNIFLLLGGGSGGDPDSLTVYQLPSGRNSRRKVFNADSLQFFSPISLAASSFNNSCAVAFGDGTVQFIDLESLQTQRVLKLQTSGLASIALSPKGDRMATRDTGGTTRLWDAQSGALLRTLSTQTAAGGQDPVSFSADGRKIVLQRDGNFEEWDAALPEDPIAVPRLAIGLTNQSVVVLAEGCECLPSLLESSMNLENWKPAAEIPYSPIQIRFPVSELSKDSAVFRIRSDVP